MYNITFMPSNRLAFDTVMSDLSRLHLLMRGAQAECVCIDLSGVSHCDSAGLAFLIEAKRLCDRNGKSLKIQSAPDQVRALAEFCGVQALWSVV